MYVAVVKMLLFYIKSGTLVNVYVIYVMLKYFIITVMLMACSWHAHGINVDKV